MSSWPNKAVPNKNAGFIILLTSIFTFFLFGEIRNLTSLTRSIHNNNGFSISSFYLSILCILWIGAQFPQEKFLSYGRILTSYYYFILMCILVIFENKIIRCQLYPHERKDARGYSGTTISTKLRGDCFPGVTCARHSPCYAPAPPADTR